MSAFSHTAPSQATTASLVLTEDQEEFRKSVAGFLGDRAREADARRLMASDLGYDPDVWAQMSAQLALPGLAVPEDLGGSGYGMSELAIVFEQMGRALLCAPYLASVGLAANLLLACDDGQAQRDLVPPIATGEMIATVALAEADGGWDAADVHATATATQPGEWVLDGEKRFVLDGHIADLILVAARTAEGVSIFAVPSTARGLSRGLLSTMDQTRKQAWVKLERTPARLLGAEGTAAAPLSRMLDLAMVAVAAEQVGGAQRMLEMTVEYAKDRVQFGRAIGSFQAIKHRLADMMLAVEQAKSVAYYAGWAADHDPADLALAARLAKSYCSDAFFKVAADSIQLHGGIGFTWEHPAHLYFKRAESSRLLFGSASTHLGAIADLVGL
jgi:alkylation response protein AidB-like acyl-CoA dehydrogenase